MSHATVFERIAKAIEQLTLAHPRSEHLTYHEISIRSMVSMPTVEEILGGQQSRYQVVCLLPELWDLVGDESGGPLSAIQVIHPHRQVGR